MCQITTWTEESSVTDQEARDNARAKWASEPHKDPLPRPERFQGTEDYEVAGIAQDAHGAEIPREGWEWSRYVAGLAVPKADNPLRNVLLAMRGSRSFKTAASYLEHISRREAAK